MKKLSVFIARRYLRSRRSHSVINIITWVSAVAIAVPVAAMIILMSVFNGFEGMIRSMFTRFDPDIMITLAEGKAFAPGDVLERINAVEGVAAASLILDESALLTYRGKQFAATVRGVDENFDKVIPIGEAIYQGEYKPYFGDIPQTLIGLGVAYNLGVSYSIREAVKIYVPRRGASFSSILPLDAFRSGHIFPSGIFMLDSQTDGEFIIVPLDYAQPLFGYRDKVSGVMVKAAGSVERLKTQLKQALGDEFQVKDRYEQKASVFRVLVAEKWGIFFIILLVLLIASCAVVGSLVMLIIDKKDDIFTLSVMGAGKETIRGVFVSHAMMISTIGAAAGLVIGLAVCLVQQHFGLIPMPAQSFLMDSYPVKVLWGDVALVAATVTAINYLIIKFTARVMINTLR